MAGENLQAFENLKENKEKSLSSQEKADLLKISPEDIRSQKEKIGDKLFTVEWKKDDGTSMERSMKLKDIVKRLVFEGNRAKLRVDNNKLVTVAWESELGAAIQVYAIANGQSVGAAGIDGKVGEGTVKGLKGTQDVVRREDQQRQRQREIERENEVKEQSPERLLNAVFTEYVGKYKDPKYNLLRTNAGTNNGTLRSAVLDGNKVSIKYKSAVSDKGYQTIVLDVNTCKVRNLYSVNKFGEAIKNAIKANEDTLQVKENERRARETRESQKANIVAELEKFDVTQFSKKGRAYLEYKDCLSFDGKHFDAQTGIGTGIFFDGEVLNIGKTGGFAMRKSFVDSFCDNGKFNKTKFKEKFGNWLNELADKHYLAEARKVGDRARSISVNTGTIASAEEKLRKAKSDMKYIKDLGVTIPSDAQAKLDDTQGRIDITRDFKEVSRDADNKLKELEEKANKPMSPAEMKKFKETVQNRYDWIVNKNWSIGGKDVYAVYSKMTNGEAKYNQLVQRITRVKNAVI